METFDVPLKPILVFLVVVARVGGLVTFAPFWSNRVASPKIRIVLAFVLAMALTPVIMTRIATPPAELGPLIVVVLGEVVIGMISGFVGKLVFSGLEMAMLPTSWSSPAVYASLPQLLFSIAAILLAATPTDIL